MTKERRSMAQDGQNSTAKRDTFPRKVRITMEPDREYEVDEPEYLELKRRGLLKEGK